MAASTDNFEESDVAGITENSQPLEQKQGSEADVGGGSNIKRWPGWPGETVFRILVPSQKIGGLIGRKGEFIKKMCEESKARIKILDGPPGIPERAVMISAKEEHEVSIPPAVDGLLRVHKRTVDGLSDSGGAPPVGAGSVSTRLLVAASQAGSLIGRQGATIKSIQEGSKCIVRVLGTDDLPAFALQDDRVVEVQGDPAGVHKAVELIASHLRKFLVDRSVLPLFELHMPPPRPHMEPPPNMPPLHQPWPHPQGPANPGGSHFLPPRSHDNYFPPADYPPLDKQSHQGVSMYGREVPPMGAHPSTNVPPQSQPMVTQHMQIPLSYADAVIGTSGASISYIRRASGATITIQETRGVPGEMTVEINGSATQVQTAQQLIQNFMAEAAAPPQHQASSVDPAYNSTYSSHGSMYAAPPPNVGHPSGPGVYGSMYGTNYGY